METEAKLISLGQSGIQVSPLGVGSNAWGAGRNADPALRAVFEAGLEAGINLFDTAEIYNMGGSEKTFGQFLPAARERVVMTSKFFPYPWCWQKSSLKKALLASLERLKIEQLDLYLVHFPLPPRAVEIWVEALAEVKEAGLVRAVGVSNYNSGQLRRAHAVLARHNIPLACNQVEYSLLKREAEKNGLLQLCKELEIILVAYRPLASGLLSGSRTAPRVQPLVKLLCQIGERHDGKTPSQVALNWVMCKGALPIPGASKLRHVQQNAGALGWRLSDEEVQALDQASPL